MGMGFLTVMMPSPAGHCPDGMGDQVFDKVIFFHCCSCFEVRAAKIHGFSETEDEMPYSKTGRYLTFLNN